MPAWQDRYLARYYNRAHGFVDGTTEFHELIAATVPTGARILEIGAGPTNQSSRFLAGLGEVHGLDPDPDVRTNEHLASAEVLDGDTYPYEDGSFDAAVSDYVVEHVEDPAAHLREVARVLRPGAPYVLRTPNRWQYVYLVSAMTPHWFHARTANRLRALEDDAHEPYPTHYAMNSVGAIRRHAAGQGLGVETLRLIEKEPSYGMAARPLFMAGMAYERVVNSTDRLRFLRSTILAVLRRAQAPAA
jgi:SAM-dependent methyltransferase